GCQRCAASMRSPVEKGRQEIAKVSLLTPPAASSRRHARLPLLSRPKPPCDTQNVHAQPDTGERFAGLADQISTLLPDEARSLQTSVVNLDPSPRSRDRVGERPQVPLLDC